MKRRILVVDDDEKIVELIELYLTNNNFEVLKANDGIEALEIVRREEIDLALIDVVIPKLDGYSLIKRVRKENRFPIIIISSKSEGYDKVLGLDIGADDYVVKPFDPLELVARVKAQLRRFYNFNVAFNENKNAKTIIALGELQLDKINFILIKRDKKIPLTYTEFKLLELFMENPNRVFTKKQLFERVWNEPYFHEDNAIMVHISNIRDKIEEDSRKPRYLKTIRGLGYKFEVDKKL